MKIKAEIPRAGITLKPTDIGLLERGRKLTPPTQAEAEAAVVKIEERLIKEGAELDEMFPDTPEVRRIQFTV